MNRQVPEKIAIIGDGKVARHMIRYFELVGQSHIQWFRQQRSGVSTKPVRKQSKLARLKNKLTDMFTPKNTAALADSLAGVSKVLLLISDDQIEPFIKAHPILKTKTCIHFSGSLNSELAIACHPLMTFGVDYYELTQYQAIPFVVDEGADFTKLFPLLKNPVYPIKAEHKVKYHAMCVMAGNFTQMLWQHIATEMKLMNLPAELMSPYLLQNTINYINNPQCSQTGPFVRGDVITIAKHQDALKTHALGDIYQAFYDLHQLSEHGLHTPSPQRNLQ